MWKIGKVDFVGKEDVVEFENGILFMFVSEGKMIVYVKD